MHVEILHVHRGWLALRRAHARVEPEIADDEISAAVAIEVSRDDAIPPPMALLEPAQLDSLELPASRISKCRDRHPLADDHEIEPTVGSDVDPERVGHHAHSRQLWRQRFRDIGEPPATVVLKEHTRRIHPVSAGNESAADEQIDVAIAVVV